MKKVTILGLLCTLMTPVFTQVNFATTKAGVFTVYQNSNVLGTCTGTEGEFLTDLNTTKNPPAMVAGDSVVFNGSWVTLPRPYVPDYRVSVDVAMILYITNDTGYFYNASGWHAESIQMLDRVIDADHAQIGDSIFVILLTENVSGDQQIFYFEITNQNTGTSGVCAVNNIDDVFLLRNRIEYHVDRSQQQVTLGGITAPLASPTGTMLIDSQTVCTPTWCIYVNDYRTWYPETATNYVMQPYWLGCDDTVGNHYYRLFIPAQGVAVDNVWGNFTAMIACPGFPTGDTAILRQDQFLSMTQKGEGTMLGGKEQRLFLNRIMYPSQGRIDVQLSFDLGLVRYEDGFISSLYQFNNFDSNALQVFDSLGVFVKKYKATDPHDAMFVDSKWSVHFGYFVDSLGFYYNPPAVMDNDSGVSYTPSIPDQFIPMIGDSCNMASAVGIMGHMDIHHGNSVQMFWVPAIQEYVVLQSARNIAKYPQSFPMAAWRFNPVTHAFVLDTSLCHLMNASPFGFGRDGGHDVQVEHEAADPNNNRWIISQYDNVVCDNHQTGPSYGHTAQLSFEVDHWEISDFRRFKASPSMAMGGIDMYGSNDTFVVINSGGSDWDRDIFLSQQIGIFNYSSQKLVGGINFGQSKRGYFTTAYQCNASSESFVEVPFKIAVVETADSLIITADTVPVTGQWFWWLGNKPTSSTLTIPKNRLFETGGVPVYISGWWSEGDTISGLAVENPLRNRWISKPVWVSFDNPSSVQIHEFLLSRIAIFPNPTQDKVSIEGLPCGSTVEIFDINGRRHGYSITSQHIDMQLWSSGIYFARITYGDQNVVRKVIKF